MIVDREALVGRSIMDLKRTEMERVIRLVHELEAELTGFEERVVPADYRIAPGEPRDRLSEPIAGEDDVIRLLKEVIDITERIVVVSVGIEVEREVPELILAGWSIQGKRELVVPVLRGDRAPGGDVLVDPFGSRDPGVRP